MEEEEEEGAHPLLSTEVCFDTSCLRTKEFKCPDRASVLKMLADPTCTNLSVTLSCTTVGWPASARV